MDTQVKRNWGTVILIVSVSIMIVTNILGLFEIQQSIANMDRQSEITNYIKCIILLRYDNPDIGPVSTRSEVEKALDNCATKL